MTAANCPTCDREECHMPDIDRKILDDKQRARIRAEHWDACWTNRVDWRARALTAEADAARWCKVAPLIERLRDARYGCTSEGEYDAVTAIVILDDGAATQEPTP